MKKTYITPDMDVIAMKMRQIVCTSGEFNNDGSGNITVDPSDSEGDFGDDNTIY